MSSFEHPSLKSSVIDGFYDLVSRFAEPADEQFSMLGCASSPLLGCANYPCRGACRVSERKTPRRPIHVRPAPSPSSPLGPRAYNDGVSVQDPMVVTHVQPPTMTPYGPAPSDLGSSASRRAASQPHSHGSSQRQAPSAGTLYGPAPVQTPYGPAPTASSRASSHSAVSRNTGSSHDLVDQHVQQFVRSHPRLRGSHRVVWKSSGVYLFDGREVTIEDMSGQGCLIVTDGPLRQPLSDYVDSKDISATYNTASLRRSNLEALSKESRMTFKDAEERYSRLDAMKVAKEQAHFREKAAEYSNAGQNVPSELLEKYEKALDIKLGRQHMSRKFRSKADQQRTDASAQAVSPRSVFGAAPADLVLEPQVSSAPKVVPEFSLFGTPSLSLNTLRAPEANLLGMPNFMSGLSLGESKTQDLLFGLQPQGFPRRGGA